jgi:hypothetical protein
MQGKDIVLNIKMLVVAHAIIKKVQDSEFNTALMGELEKMLALNCNPEEHLEKKEKGSVEIKVENTKEDFMQRNIISFYCFYLKKFMINLDTYFLAKSYNPANYESKEAIETINQGFLVLNLVNYILRSQYTFNKMGRYYLPHK